MLECVQSTGLPDFVTVGIVWKIQRSKILLKKSTLLFSGLDSFSTLLMPPFCTHFVLFLFYFCFCFMAPMENINLVLDLINVAPKSHFQISDITKEDWEVKSLYLDEDWASFARSNLLISFNISRSSKQQQKLILIEANLANISYVLPFLIGYRKQWCTWFVDIILRICSDLRPSYIRNIFFYCLN